MLSANAPDKIDTGDREMLEAEARRTLHNSKIANEKKKIVDEVKEREDYLNLPPPRREKVLDGITALFDKYHVDIPQRPEPGRINSQIESRRALFSTDLSSGRLREQVERVMERAQR